MKMKQRNRIIAYIITSVAAMATILACVFTSIDFNKTSSVETVKYNLSNTISEDNMLFEVISETDKTCKFIGIRATSHNMLTDTLSIPENATIADQLYKVVEIDTADSDGLSPTLQEDGTYMSSMYYYGSYITALIVPKTVTKVNEGAFYGMASLQYLETPFTVGMITSSTTTYSGLWPIHKLFAKGYGITDGPGYQPEYSRVFDDSTSNKLSTEIRWWDMAENSKVYYQVPSELEKIVINKATVFGNRTFVNIDSLVETVLPEGLTNIGQYVFASCGQLTDVDLPLSLQNFGVGMFSECTAMTDIVVPRIDDLPDDCFGGCTALTNVVLPTGLKQIGEKAFSNCTNLNIKLYKGDDPSDNYGASDMSVIFPEGLKSIGAYAFQGCETIDKIEIPSNVEKIGEGAFLGCANMTSISLPFIGSGNKTAALTKDNNFGYIFGLSGDQANFYRRVQNGVTYSFPKKLETINISNETAIEAGTLANLCLIENNTVVCGVTTIVVNKGCAVIQAGAMAGSNNLKYLTIPYIGSNTNHSSFGLLFQFDTATNPNNVSTAGATATGQNAGTFYIPRVLESVIVTNQGRIYTGSFYNCVNIKNIEIGNATTYIEDSIFHNNQNLTSIKLPFVGNQAGEWYDRWWWWKDNYIRNMLTWAFSGSSFTGAYYDTTIADGASYRRSVPSTLKEVEITHDTEIDYRSFRNLTSLEVLTISDEEGVLRTIEQGAAYNCSSLKTLNIPFIGADYNTSSQDGSSHRAGWIFGSGGKGYNASGFTIPNDLETVNVAYVDRIPANSFRDMTSLQTVSFDRAVSKVGAYAFSGCINLATVDYTEDTKFKEIESYAYYNCQKINTMEAAIPAIDAGSVKLGSYALAKTSISEIDFTKLVSVGDYCFSGCLNVEAVDVGANVTTFGKGVFADCMYLTSAKLGQGKATDYLFKNCYSLEKIDLSRVIVDGVIPEGIFQGCKKLQWGEGNANVGLVLNDQITTIKANAFADCQSLTRFVIPANVTSIGDGAFRGATNLENMTIPTNVTKIGKNVFTESIGHGFIIWVYIPEDEWPWESGWNCLNPVKVLPGTDDSMYTFEFNDTLRGYIITGFKSEFEGRLSGGIVLPTEHDGVTVVGVDDGLFKTQVNVTRVVVPACINYIGMNSFDNGKRVDVYFEDTKAKAPVEYDHANKIAGMRVYDNSTALQGLIAIGLVFYGDQWTYGKGVGNDTIPYVKSSTLKYNVDTQTTTIIYNSKAWTPAVFSAQLPAIEVTNASLGNITSIIPSNVYNYTYSNNINAGRASIKATISSAQYPEYLESQGLYPVYLTGDGQASFEIQKKTIEVYYNEDLGYTERETVYNPNKAWSAYNWSKNNVYGIGDDYVFSGTLSVRRNAAGLFYIYGQERNEDFYWPSGWNVTYKGVNVSSNFEVIVWLELVVDKLKVNLVWGGERKDDLKYHYAYTGRDIIPTAYAYSEDGEYEIPECKVYVVRDSGNRTIYPGDGGVARAYLTAASVQNYELMNGEIEDNTGIICVYEVDVAKLKITIRDDKYVIPYLPTNAQCYSFSDWSNTKYYTVTGLAEGSVINGTLVSVAGSSYTTAKDRNEIYSSKRGGIEWLMQDYNLPELTGDSDFTYNSTTNPTLAFLIGRYDANGKLTLIENDFYDIELDVDVKINYNDFEYEYYVGDTKLDLREIKTEEGRVYYSATYHTDGVEKPVEIRVTNEEVSTTTDGGVEIKSYDVIYYYTGAASGTSIPLKVLEVGTYSFSTDVTRENFNPLYQVIELNVVKSDIEHKNLDKEYDGEPLDLTGFITKCGIDQDIELTVCDASKRPTAEAISPGTYYIHIVASETRYFNECDVYYKFTISKRVIHIYVDRAKYFDPNSTPYVEDFYKENGESYYINVDSEALSTEDRRYLVGTDNIYGVLWTKSGRPGIYDTEVPGDWYWRPAWSVYDGVTTTNKANVYYDVMLHGSFEIKPLQMQITHHGETKDYDGNFYSSTINITKPTVGYKVYYSLDAPTIVYDPELRQFTDELTTWRTANYSFQVPGEYDVYFKVVCNNYETFYGMDKITINYVPITFDDPSVFKTDSDGKLYLDYTMFPQTIEIENVDPFTAVVEYSLNGSAYTTDPCVVINIGSYVLEYKISYPNYETITGSYSFRVTEDFLTSLEGYVYATADDADYDALPHTISVNVTYPSLTGYTIYYRETGSKAEWTTAPVSFVNAGNYSIDYLVKAQGFKTYQGSATFTINTLDFEGLGITNYAADYDGEAHTVETVGTDAYPGLKVYYTTNEDIAFRDSMDFGGWSEDPIEFTNVGAYTVYVRFVLKNYNTKTMVGTVLITKVNPTVEFTDGVEVEYKGDGVTVADLKIVTCHDGIATPKYFSATKNSLGEIIIDSTTPILPPSELGLYYVVIDYANTNNCYPMSVELGFEIVPRKLTVIYDEKVEYNGAEQMPEPTVNSGTGDILYITSTREGSQNNPIEIGKYYYKFEFLTPQTNYVLVTPENPEHPGFPFLFEITAIKLDIVIDESMDYDYENQRYWYKDSGWEEYACFDKLLQNHTFSANMRTSGYSRGTYYYISTSEVSYLNRVIVSNPIILDRDGHDVSSLYEITYDIRVRIVFPELKVTVDENRNVVYDGNPHGLEITVPDNVRNLTYYYATEADYQRGDWLTNKVTYTNAGVYKIYFKIESPNYEDYIGSAMLTITKASLNIQINPFDETYDAYPHYASHRVDNVVGLSASQAIVRYYNTKNYTLRDIEACYSSFSPSNSLVEEGLTSAVDAGTYYVAVIYVDNGNYYTSYTIGQITVKQRELQVTLSASHIATYDYDGYKKEIALGSGSYVDPSNLVYGHRIVGGTANTIIQTISPNAGTYMGSSGFEFKYDERYKTIIIKDAVGNVVTTNYKPVVDDISLEINILKIYLDEFEAIDEEARIYDGNPANPQVITPSDGPITYVYYPVDEDGLIAPHSINAYESANVGTYYVVCAIGEGTNYFAWDGPAVGAYVTIVPKEAEVKWEDLEVTFNAEGQAPKAYITDVFGDRYDLDVYVRYNGDMQPSVVQAGAYEVVAASRSENYTLTSYINIFTINKLEFTLTFKDKTDAADSQWILPFDVTRFPSFPNQLSLYNATKTGSALIKTVDYKPGTYTLESDFILDVSVWLGDLDVTDSIKFIINGFVEIIANDIIFEVEDQEFVYDGSSHLASSYINIVSPIARNVTALYGLDAASPTDNQSPSFVEVGSYKVNFSLSASGYDTVSGSFVINIVAKQSYLNFTASLNKVYDGTAIDAAKVKSVINGEYNGSVDDLVFTFYNNGSNVALTDNPVDAGEYRLVITSRADEYVTDHNYTTLNVERYFEITPKSINLTVPFDYEVDDTKLGQRWTSGQISDTTIQGLGAYNTLYYEFASVDEYLERGTFKFQETAYYNPDTTTSEYYMNGFGIYFTWNVLADHRYDSEMQKLDVSFNYNINIDFKLVIHYPYMTVVINDVDERYDGNPHSGSDVGAVQVPTNPQNLVKKYGTSVGDLSISSISSYTATDPGEYKVYYLYECDGYEPEPGFFTINIGFDVRGVEVDDLSREYIPNVPVGTLTGDYYLPTFRTTLGPSGKPDNYLASGEPVKVTYYEKGYKTPLSQVINAGEYEYELVIPASRYYEESIVHGEFRISRKVIYIDGTYTAGYKNAVVSFSDFDQPSSPFTMHFTDGSLIPSTFRFTGLSLKTTDLVIGKYQGMDESLILSDRVRIYSGTTDVSVNYQVQLYKSGQYNAAIVIEKGIIDAEPINVRTAYDQQYHTIDVRVKTPGYSIQYSKNYDGPYQDELIREVNVGTYTIYIKVSAPNYKDKIVAATLEIVQAETTLTVPGLSKWYDGKPVLPPENLTSNNTASRTDYTFEYERYNQTLEDYEDLAAQDYPVNAGKYRLIITVPGTENYAAAEFVKEFEIWGLNTSITWDKTSFVYNGESQSPAASFDTVPGDVVNKVYEYTYSADNVVPDADHKHIGVYTVTVKLDTENPNYIFDETQTTVTFTIVPRTITITLNKGVTYNALVKPSFINSEDGYQAINIVPGHYVNATLQCRFVAPNNYVDISQFEWISSTNAPIILNTNNENEDVTFDYTVKYSIRLNINYSELRYTIDDYDEEYDGELHGITVTILNSFAEGETRPVITYSLSPNGEYRSERPLFRDYTNYQNVYFRITCPGYVPINGVDNPDGDCYGVVNIRKMNAGLVLENEYQVFDKYYDGVAVSKPAMVYADMDKKERTVTYTFYKKETDPTKPNFGTYSVVENAIFAGEYRLVVTLGESENYDNGTFSRDFVIRKRNITVSLPDGMTQDTKEFNNKLWSMTVTANMVDHMSGPDSSTGLVDGDFFSRGIIQTKHVDYGVYDDENDFEWNSSYAISNGKDDVTLNYTVSIDLYVYIKKADIKFESHSVEVTYDRQPHTIELEVTEPTIGYTVLYATENVESSYTTAPIYKQDVGRQVVYFKISAENYNSVTWSEEIVINGVENNGTLIGPTGTIYYGDIYITPYYSGDSLGDQSVTYYLATDVNKLNGFTDKPVNAGAYTYRVHLDTDGVYSAENFDGSFTIKKLEIAVDWSNEDGDSSLTQTYTGSALKPIAHITTLEEEGIELVVADEYAQTDVGTYDVEVTYDNSNYLLTNAAKKFVITKREITIPDVVTDMIFRYQFNIPMTDAEGEPVVDEEGNQMYYEFGDKVAVRDIDGNVYVLDDEGNIIAIKNSAGEVINDNPDLEYKFILDSNLNACTEENEKRTLQLVLKDKANNRWAEVSDFDNDQYVYYTIVKYHLPDDEDYTSLKATIGGYSYEYNDEPITPTPTVVLNYQGATIADVDSSIYKVEYINNEGITNKVSKVKITGLGNYDFDIEIDFMIVERKPELLALVPAAKPVFMQVIADATGVKFVEDRSVIRTEENRSDFYLGHLHQNTFISKLMEQIDSPLENLKVFNNKGVEIDKSKYATTLIGTGYDIVLYNKDGNEIDRITTIIFGDINGDGIVSIGDNTVYANFITADASKKITLAKIQSGAYASDETMSYYTEANYYAAMVTRGTSACNPSIGYMTTILDALKATGSIDFNAEYKLD